MIVSYNSDVMDTLFIHQDQYLRTTAALVNPVQKRFYFCCCR